MKEKTKLAKIHFVCTGGCGLVVNEPGKCTTAGCYRHRNPLTECKCKNEKHGKFLKLNVPKGAPLPTNSILKKKLKISV
jgi:hypothetical protein